MRQNDGREREKERNFGRRVVRRSPNPNPHKHQHRQEWKVEARISVAGGGGAKGSEGWGPLSPGLGVQV